MIRMYTSVCVHTYECTHGSLRLTSGVSLTMMMEAKAPLTEAGPHRLD